MPFASLSFYDCVDHIKLWKILKEMGIPDPDTTAEDTDGTQLHQQSTSNSAQNLCN